MAASHVRYGYRRLTVLLQARRLESECEAHLPAVHGGAVDRAHQAATQDYSASAWKHSHRDSSEPLLEHRFCLFRKSQIALP